MRVAVSTWRRSPSGSGPCQGNRSSTRSRPGAGRPQNAILRAGNARRCALDLQIRGTAVPRAAAQAHGKRNDHRSQPENLRPVCSQRSKLPTLVDLKSLYSHPISVVFHQPQERKRPVLGRERTGRRRAGRGDIREGARRDIKYFQSCRPYSKQISMQEAAFVRVKQSKSLQIVVSADACASTHFTHL